MKRRYFQRLNKNERGASLVEFAIAVPVLLIMVFAIIEFAWILNGFITLTGAVREGARLAVVSSHSAKSESEIEAEVRQLVMDHARTFQLSEEDIEVKFGNYEIKEETYVEIEEARLPLLVGFFPIANPYVIRDIKATMMHE